MEVFRVIEAIVVILAISALGGMGFYSYATAKERSPSVVDNLNQVVEALSRRVRQLEQDSLQRYEELRAMRDQMEAWINYAQTLVARLKILDPHADLPPPPARAIPVMHPLPTDDRALAQVITSLFNRDEVDDLAFRLGIKDGEIGGDTNGARARNLVNYAQRHGMTDSLIALARQLRPEGNI